MKTQLAEIEEGIKDADAGRVVSQADVQQWLNTWGTDNERASIAPILAVLHAAQQK